MGFNLGKIITNAIFEDDGSPENASAQNQQSVAAPSPGIQPAVGSTQVTTIQASDANTSNVSQSDKPGEAYIDSNGNVQYTGKLREKFAELMLQSIEERNIPGPDYAELKSAFESEDMKTNIPDSSKRWKTAFSTMKMMDKKFSKSVVLNSIDEYVRVVDEERETALSQMKKKYDSTVGVMQKDLINAENNIKGDEDRIAQLKEQIRQIEEKISSNKTFINQTREKITNGKIENFIDCADLETTAKAIRDSLLNDKNTLNEILTD